DLATPRAVFEAPCPPRRLLNGCDILPGLVVAWMVTMMHCIEDREFRLPGSIQDLQHVRNTIVGFCNSPNAGPYFATVGDEVVIRIDNEKCSELLAVCHFRHGLSPNRGRNTSLPCSLDEGDARRLRRRDTWRQRARGERHRCRHDWNRSHMEPPFV